jgi:hypothetical protein
MAGVLPTQYFYPVRKPFLSPARSSRRRARGLRSRKRPDRAVRVDWSRPKESSICSPHWAGIGGTVAFAHRRRGAVEQEMRQSAARAGVEDRLTPTDTCQRTLCRRINWPLSC